MRVGEAFEKITGEVGKEIAKELGISPNEDGRLAMEDLPKFDQPTNVLVRLSYDGSAKDFISSRAKKKATAMIEEAEASGFDFRQLHTEYGVLMQDLIGKWHYDMLQILAMGYSFAAPEFSDVPKDKEGFLKLCREVDRDLISIQVAQFATDEMLRESLERRIDSAAELVSHAFSAMQKPITKFAMRDWFFQVFATVSLNCFIAGQKIRDLLEEELAFEAMMKETD
jgi:hypothetical protein